MSDKERLLHENTALVALLNTIDKTKNTWNSIADKVERQCNTVDVYQHELDSKHHKLNDADEDMYGDYGEGALFNEDDVPINEERKNQLNKALLSTKKQVLDWERQGLDFVSVPDDRYPSSSA